MTSDEKKPGFDDQPDNEMESIEIETVDNDDMGDDVGDALDDLERELSDDDEIDMNAEEDFSFDIEEEHQVKRGGGGLKKVAAPALVLLLAAGVGGYIVMNPDVISGLMGGGSSTPPAIQQTATAPSAFGGPMDEDEQTDLAELPQPSGVVNDIPAPVTGFGGGGGALDTNTPRGPEGEMVVADNEELAAPDSFVTATPETTPVVEEPVIPVEEDVVELTEPEAEEAPAVTAMDEPPVEEPVAAVAVEEPVAEDDMIEQGSADAGPVVETASAEEAVVPEMPVAAPVTAQAPAQNTAQNTAPASNPQNNIGVARPPQAAGNDEPTAYYESGVNLPPTGSMADKNIRRVDPKVEPAQKYIIATQDASKSSQEAVLQSARRALDLQRYDAALELYEQLYAKNKRDERIMMGLAVAQQNTGRPESAIQTYEALLDLNPNNANAMVNMLGLLRNTYPEVALRRLLDLQDKFPNNAGIAAQIGVTQADLGHHDDAVRYLQIAASLEPQNAQHLFNIAVIADRKGAVADAIRYYEEALETDAVYQGSRSLPRDTIYDRLAKLRSRI